jgi:hypothetical protein
MAVAFVQKSTELFADNASSIAPSLGGVTAGNLVVCVCACIQGASNTTLATPAGWTLAKAPAGQGSGGLRPVIGIWYKENASSGTQSATINFAAGSYAEASIVEFSGVKTSSSLANTNSNAGGGTNAGGNSAGAANTVATAVAIAVCTATDSGSLPSNLSSPATTGYSVVDNEPAGSTHCAYDISYKILSSVASETASWTWTSNVIDWEAGIAVFDGVSGVSNAIAWIKA